MVVSHRPAEAPAPARRRGKQLEQAIFEAVLEQLVSSGYSRMTMEGVAVGAQTGKAALYRRWTSKEQLVMDALAATLPPTGGAPDTGSLRDDLVELLHRVIAAMNSVPGAALRAVIGELDHEHARSFMGLVHERVIDPVRRLQLEVLAAGERRGEVRPGAVTPMVADVLPALLLYRAKFCGGVPQDADAEALVDEVLLPIVRA